MTKTVNVLRMVEKGHEKRIPFKERDRCITL
jgi:hypothetical protein